MRELRQPPQAGKLFRKSRNPLLDEVATKPPGDEVEIAARMARPRGERARKPLACIIEALHHGREDRVRLGSAADREVEALAAPFDPARQALMRAMLQLAELGE